MEDFIRAGPTISGVWQWLRGHFAEQRWQRTSERMVPVAATATLHLLALAWLIFLQAPPLVVHPSMAIFSLSAPIAGYSPSLSTPPSLPSPKASDEPRSEALPESQARQTQKTDDALTSDTCAPLEAVTKAIAADIQTRTAIPAVSPSERSISQAIVIWNAGWSDTVSAVNAPLASARTTIEQALALLPAQCLDETVIGPRLIPVEIDRGTAFLVIGSGSWNWRQITVDEAQSQTAPIFPTK